MIYIIYGCLAMGIFTTATLFFLIGYKRKIAEKSKVIEQLKFEKKLIVFKAAAEAEERERERIARNLHDEVNLMLAVHKQVLEKHAFDFEGNNFNLADFSKEIQNIEEISEAVTACATNLVPAFLIKNGLYNTLEDHVRHINQAGKLKARFNNLLNEHSSKLFEKQDELNIYRVCLELVNNILKHAHPSELTVTASHAIDGLLIQIDHNGRKVTDKEIELFLNRRNGLGLNSIKARCMILKAHVHYSDSEKGPAIVLTIPFYSKITSQNPIHDNG